MKMKRKIREVVYTSFQRLQPLAFILDLLYFWFCCGKWHPVSVKNTIIHMLSALA